jgi:hypothetical protein
MRSIVTPAFDAEALVSSSTRAPAASDPALRQMMRPIVQHVAALAERAQVP